MKKVIFSIIALLAIASVQSCKRGGSSTPNPTAGNVKIYFNNLANGQNIDMGGTPIYTNALGQKFSVNILKYYISQIRLTDDKGVVVNLGNFSLIDEDPTTPKKEVLFANVPPGNYTIVTFNFGLDKVTNALPTGEGDLDHSHGMWWGTEKYLFLKHKIFWVDYIELSNNKDIVQSGGKKKSKNKNKIIITPWYKITI